MIIHNEFQTLSNFTPTAQITHKKRCDNSKFIQTTSDSESYINKCDMPRKWCWRESERIGRVSYREEHNYEKAEMYEANRRSIWDKIPTLNEPICRRWQKFDNDTVLHFRLSVHQSIRISWSHFQFFILQRNFRKFAQCFYSSAVIFAGNLHSCCNLWFLS